MKENLQKAVYFPGLNGIRAIASIAVVISHITLALPADFHISGDLLGPVNVAGTRAYFLGPYGVTMFFVLSGFLITYLMQLEAEKTGNQR